MPTLAYNRKAKFDYQILDKYEAGIVLLGHEVKAVKAGKISLKGSYAIIRSNEAYLINALISPYQPKNTPDIYDPTRTRKLLLHKKELKELIGKIKQKGLTLVPLRVYTKTDRIKIEIGIGHGKKSYDKRQSIQKRETDRRIGRALRSKR